MSDIGARTFTQKKHRYKKLSHNTRPVHQKIIQPSMNSNAPNSTMGSFLPAPVERALPTSTTLEYKSVAPSSLRLNNENEWKHDARPAKKKTKHYLGTDHTYIFAFSPANRDVPTTPPKRTVHWAADSRWNCQEAKDRSSHAPSKPVRTSDALQEVEVQPEISFDDYEIQLNDQPHRAQLLEGATISFNKKRELLLDDLSGMLAAVSSSESESDGDYNVEEDSDDSGETTAFTPRISNLCYSRRDTIAGHKKSTSPSKVVIYLDAHAIPPSLAVPNLDWLHQDPAMVPSP